MTYPAVSITQIAFGLQMMPKFSRQSPACKINFSSSQTYMKLNSGAPSSVESWQMSRTEIYAQKSYAHLKPIASLSSSW